MEGFKERLVLLRKKENLTQQELAEKMGTTFASISNYESGKRYPNMELLIKFADYFGCSLDYLTGRATTPKGIIVTDEINGHTFEAEVDSRVYPDGMTHEDVVKLLNKLKAAGIKIDIDC